MSTTASYTGGANADSGWIKTNPTFFQSGSDIAFGYWQTGGVYGYWHFYTRIVNITIPRNSTIISATINHYFSAYDGDATGNMYYGTSSSVAPTSNADFVSRALTFITSFNYYALGWRSSTITTSLNTIVHGAGWNSGDAILFFFYGNVWGYRSGYGYSNATYRPYLSVTYDPPSGILGRTMVIGL